ncbi:MAG: hypothetical protein KBT45_07860 [Bacteroidales bacterium]|nr:hypothetical protein [Candidatus Colimorpha pelethequi]
MKKIFIAIGVVAVLASFASCSKTCSCKETITYEDMSGDWSEMGDLGGSATFTQETKGKCSKLNVESHQSMCGMNVIDKVECE